MENQWFLGVPICKPNIVRLLEFAQIFRTPKITNIPFGTMENLFLGVPILKHITVYTLHFDHETISSCICPFSKKTPSYIFCGRKCLDTAKVGSRPPNLFFIVKICPKTVI